MGCPETGDIKYFKSEDEAKKAGYTVPLCKGEYVQILNKPMWFKITGIDGNNLNLKGVSVAEVMANVPSKVIS